MNKTTDRCRSCRLAAERVLANQCRRRWPGGSVDDLAGPCACVVELERAADNAFVPTSTSHRAGLLMTPPLESRHCSISPAVWSTRRTI